MFKFYENENVELLIGTIKELEEKNDKLTLVTISGSEYSKESKKEEPVTETVAFWNGKKNLADRIKKFKIGTNIMVLAGKPNEEGKDPSCLIFKLAGAFKFNEGTDEEINIIKGNVVKVDKPEDKNYCHVSVPESVYAEGKETTVWHNITFWDGKQKKNATNALKCLDRDKEGKMRQAVLVCGKESLYRENKQYTGFRFEVVKNSEVKKRTPETPPAAPKEKTEKEIGKTICRLGRYGKNPQPIEQIYKEAPQWFSFIVKTFNPTKEEDVKMRDLMAEYWRLVGQE